MSRRGIEFFVGLFVAAGVAALFMLAMKVSNLSTVSMGEAYHLTARFQEIGGLNVRSPVKASGVRVGRVSGIDYDEDRNEAIVRLSIEREFDRFSKDSIASIYTAGLLGEQYISIEPGIEEEYLDDGDTLYVTEPAVILERLLGKIIVNKLTE